jgi:protein phosphatase 1 regulatory subunit 10
MPALSPTFYGQQGSAPQTISPQVRKEQFEAAIKPLLQSSLFTGAGAVNNLVNQISDYGSQDVDGQIRLEILTKIRDNAGNHYFRAWAENVTAIDITREWLKTAFTSKGDSPLVETTMPLLQVRSSLNALRVLSN